MANLSNALQQLREEHKHAQREVEKLELAISAIEGIAQRNGSAAGNRSTATRIVSAIARRRMARAQRARWARVKAQHGGAKPAGGARRGRLSVAARRKIAAAQRARWARFRADQAKKAA